MFSEHEMPNERRTRGERKARGPGADAARGRAIIDFSDAHEIFDDEGIDGAAHTTEADEMAKEQAVKETTAHIGDVTKKEAIGSPWDAPPNHAPARQQVSLLEAIGGPAIPDEVHGIVALFETDLSEVSFPGVSAEVLSSMRDVVYREAEAVAELRQALDERRAALKAAQASLHQTAAQAYRYAQIFGAGDEALTASLEAIDFEKPESKRGKRAGKRGGRSGGAAGVGSAARDGAAREDIRETDDASTGPTAGAGQTAGAGPTAGAGQTAGAKSTRKRGGRNANGQLEIGGAARAGTGDAGTVTGQDTAAEAAPSAPARLAAEDSAEDAA